MKQNVHRRDFFNWSANGLGATALLGLLANDGLIRADDNILSVSVEKETIPV